jgi:UDP-glucose 4-epimerase
VSDLAEAHIRALEYLLDGGESAALNLGTGRGHSVREVVAAVQRCHGRAIPVIESRRRPGDPPVLVANARRARKLLGWRPRFQSLEAIVHSAWRWHAAHHQQRRRAAAV